MRISSLAAALLVGVGFSIGVSPASFAQDAGAAEAVEAVEAVEASLPSGKFIKKKKKKLKGSWEVVQRDGNTYIKFADDFRASKGPDLKVFLSPLDVATVTGKTATEGALNIGELEKTKGAQEYLVPAEVNIADYASVLVHCEKFAVLWGGGDF